MFSRPDFRTTWKLFPICYWRKLGFHIEQLLVSLRRSLSSNFADWKSSLKEDGKKIMHRKCKRRSLLPLRTNLSAQFASLSMQRACCVCVLDSWIRKSWKSCSFAVHCCDVCMRWHIYFCFWLFCLFSFSSLSAIFFWSKWQICFRIFDEIPTSHSHHHLSFAALNITLNSLAQDDMTDADNITDALTMKSSKESKKIRSKRNSQIFCYAFLCKHTKKAKKKQESMKGESKYKHTTTRRLASNKKKVAKKKKKIFRIIFWVLRPTFMPHAAALSLNILSWSASWPAMLLEIEIFFGRCYQFFFPLKWNEFVCRGEIEWISQIIQQLYTWMKTHEKLINIILWCFLVAPLLSRGELIFSSLRKQPLSSGW